MVKAGLDILKGDTIKGSIGIREIKIGFKSLRSTLWDKALIGRINLEDIMVYGIRR
ncbi:MAG: hypothetical protein GXZ06_09180 [Tissierellia bacterium]|nr:hypothetical protein [Tissierellia bacterium]